jgi:hypothetical protein
MGGAGRRCALGALREFRVGTWTIEKRILETACLLDQFRATIGAAWQGKLKGLVVGWPMDCQEGAMIILWGEQIQ